MYIHGVLFQMIGEYLGDGKALPSKSLYMSRKTFFVIFKIETMINNQNYHLAQHSVLLLTILTCLSLVIERPLYEHHC